MSCRKLGPTAQRMIFCGTLLIVMIATATTSNYAKNALTGQNHPAYKTGFRIGLDGESRLQELAEFLTYAEELREELHKFPLDPERKKALEATRYGLVKRYTINLEDHDRWIRVYGYDKKVPGDYEPLLTKEKFKTFPY